MLKMITRVIPLLSWRKSHVWVSTEVNPSIWKVLNRKDLMFQPLEELRFEPDDLGPLVRMTGHNCDPSHQSRLSGMPSYNCEVLWDEHRNPLQAKADDYSTITKSL